MGGEPLYSQQTDLLEIDNVFSYASKYPWLPCIFTTYCSISIASANMIVGVIIEFVTITIPLRIGHTIIPSSIKIVCVFMGREFICYEGKGQHAQMIRKGVCRINICTHQSYVKFCQPNILWVLCSSQFSGIILHGECIQKYTKELPSSLPWGGLG